MYDDTPLVMVEDDATLIEVAARLARAPAIGVDTESDSFYSYKEKVCLIQISDLETDYVIDPLRVRDMSPLGPIMADEGVVKIFHGADYDVVCMRRDYGFVFHNLFDTMIASQLLGLPRIGLADIIGQFFGLEIEKKYQRHDWSRRPLGDEHIEYARGDSHFLPALREILIHRLQRCGRLGHVEEECTLLEKREWTPRPPDAHAWLRIKTAGSLDDKGLRVLKRLHAYREQEAARMNRPVFKVIGDTDLVSVAKLKPTTTKALDHALPGRGGLKRQHAAALLDAVVNGLNDTYPIPSPEPKARAAEPEGPPPRLRGRASERAMAELKNWRNDLVNRHARLTPVSVISNGTLKEIARMRPTTRDQLREVSDVRRWQVKDFGDAILRVLDRVAPWNERDEKAYQVRLARWQAKQQRRQGVSGEE